MKYLFASIITIALFVSCSKNQDETTSEQVGEEIQVVVVATHANDTTITATTNIIRMKVK